MADYLHPGVYVLVVPVDAPEIRIPQPSTAVPIYGCTCTATACMCQQRPSRSWQGGTR